MAAVGVELFPGFSEVFIHGDNQGVERRLGVTVAVVLGGDQLVDEVTQPIVLGDPGLPVLTDHFFLLTYAINSTRAPCSNSATISKTGKTAAGTDSLDHHFCMVDNLGASYPYAVSKACSAIGVRNWSSRNRR